MPNSPAQISQPFPGSKDSSSAAPISRLPSRKQVINFLALLAATAAIIFTARAIWNFYQKTIAPQETKVIKDFPEFTGAVFEPFPTLSPEKEKIQTQFSTLRDQTPLAKSGFTIDFDYRKNKFNIILEKPHNSNKNAFLNWIKDNGYESIPQEKIKYTLSIN